MYAIEPLPNVVELWQAEDGDLLLPSQRAAVGMAGGRRVEDNRNIDFINGSARGPVASLWSPPAFRTEERQCRCPAQSRVYEGGSSEEGWREATSADFLLLLVITDHFQQQEGDRDSVPQSFLTCMSREDPLLMPRFLGHPVAKVLYAYNPSADSEVVVTSVSTAATHFHVPPVHCRTFPLVCLRYRKVLPVFLFMLVSGIGTRRISTEGSAQQLPNAHFLLPRVQSIQLSQNQSCYLESDDVLRLQMSIIVTMENASKEFEENTQDLLDHLSIVYVATEKSETSDDSAVNMYILHSGASLIWIQDVHHVSPRAALSLQFTPVLLPTSATNFTKIASFTCKAAPACDGGIREGVKRTSTPALTACLSSPVVHGYFRMDASAAQFLLEAPENTSGVWSVWCLNHLDRGIIVNDVSVSKETKHMLKEGSLGSEVIAHCGMHYFMGKPAAENPHWDQSLSLDRSTWGVDAERADKLYASWKRHRSGDVCKRAVLGTTRLGLLKRSRQPEPFAVFLPRLLAEPGLVLNFSATALRNSLVKYFVVRNPSSLPVSLQLLPLSAYPEPGAAVHLLHRWFGTDMQTINLTTREFQLTRACPHPGVHSQESRLGALHLRLKPLEQKRVGVVFTPADYGRVTSLILIRNNLTVLDMVAVEGFGARELLRVGGQLPGTGGSLRFKVPESTLMECQRRYGFEVRDCHPFSLDPNTSRDISIVFTPDFTSSWVVRELTLVSAARLEFHFTLNVTLPHHLLPVCADVVPGPSWEESFWRLTVVLVSVSLLGVIAVAFQQAQHILVEFVKARQRQHAGPSSPPGSGAVDVISSHSHKSSCKSFLDAYGPPDKGRGKSCLPEDSCTDVPGDSWISLKYPDGGDGSLQESLAVPQNALSRDEGAPGHAVGALAPPSGWELGERAPAWMFPKETDVRTAELCALKTSKKLPENQALRYTPQDPPDLPETSRKNHGNSQQVPVKSEGDDGETSKKGDTKSSSEKKTHKAPKEDACSDKQDVPSVEQEDPYRKKKLPGKKEGHLQNLNWNKNRTCKKNKKRGVAQVSRSPEQSELRLVCSDLERAELSGDVHARTWCVQEGSGQVCEGDARTASNVPAVQRGAERPCRKPGHKCADKFCSDSSSDCGSSSGSVRASRGRWGSWSSSSSSEGDKKPAGDPGRFPLAGMRLVSPRSQSRPVPAFQPGPQVTERTKVAVCPIVAGLAGEPRPPGVLEGSCLTCVMKALLGDLPCLSSSSAAVERRWASPELPVVLLAGGAGARPALRRPRGGWSPEPSGMGPAAVWEPPECSPVAGLCPAGDLWPAQPVCVTSSLHCPLDGGAPCVLQEPGPLHPSSFIDWGAACEGQLPSVYCPLELNDYDAFPEENMNYANGFPCPAEVPTDFLEHHSQSAWSAPPSVPAAWGHAGFVGSPPYLTSTRSLSPMSGLFGSIWAPQSDVYEACCPLSPAVEHPGHMESQAVMCKEYYPGFDPFRAYMNLDIWTSTANRSAGFPLPRDPGYCGNV
ncbi:Transmembrane protein 131-like protein [Tupaia chinensis]|uniref:Transmembrane protein 131-like protein n=1 Tax=Tupaia chinensis TaxID=246437 RepID=L9KPR4_TUPCH|nr:Transmembrane protein 131-like protein [Tupaia chinensis]